MVFSCVKCQIKELKMALEQRDERNLQGLREQETVCTADSAHVTDSQFRLTTCVLH